MSSNYTSLQPGEFIHVIQTATTIKFLTSGRHEEVPFYMILRMIADKILEVVADRDYGEVMSDRDEGYFTQPVPCRYLLSESFRLIQRS